MFWNIKNIDLSKDIGPLNMEKPSQGVFVVFWWQEIPLGHRYIWTKHLPMSADRLAGIAFQEIAPTINHYFSEYGLKSKLAERATPLSNIVKVGSEAEESLKELLIQMSNLESPTYDIRNHTDISVSIIIPTLNRHSKLFECLQSITTLRLMPHEIIVVDNGSQDFPMQSLINRFPNVRCISETKNGSSAARNTGVKNCNGDLIVFVDDDEIVHPDWLSHLVNCFSEPQIGVVTGLVLPIELNNEAQYMFEKRFSFVRGYKSVTFDKAYYLRHRKTGVPVWDIGGSGNMAIRRSVFEELNGFDEMLGAGQAGCSEDSALFYAALVSGWECKYEPRAVTFHAHRSNLESLRRQLFFYMRGHVAALLTQFDHYKDLGNLFRLFVILPLVYIRNFIRAFTGNSAFRFSLLFAEIAGCFSGSIFYLRNRGKR